MLMMMMRVPWRHLVQICRCFRPKDFAGPPATVATGNWQPATGNWQHQRWQVATSTSTSKSDIHFGYLRIFIQCQKEKRLIISVPLFHVWENGFVVKDESALFLTFCMATIEWPVLTSAHLSI